MTHKQLILHAFSHTLLQLLLLIQTKQTKQDSLKTVLEPMEVAKHAGACASYPLLLPQHSSSTFARRLTHTAAAASAATAVTADSNKIG
jgi:hypothetical protein